MLMGEGVSLHLLYTFLSTLIDLLILTFGVIDMLFTEEHLALKDTVVKFVEKEINPFVDEWERDGMFPAHKLYKKAGQLGLLGISKDEKYGGLGLDYSFQSIFAEALGNAAALGVPLGLGVQTTMATPALEKYGSDTLKEQFLAPAISGDFVCSIAVSEPQAGSDVAALKTSAKRDGDDLVLNGTKMWITNSTQSDFMCVLANTSEGPVHSNKSLIVVPSNEKGLSFGNKLDKLGARSSDTAQVFFDDVRVPASFIIGDEGHGFKYQMEQFQEERLWLALYSTQAMQRCIDITSEYTSERAAFGRRIVDNQVVYFTLSELSTEIAALRALCFEAVEELVQGKDVTLKASMAKLKAGKLCRRVTDECLQFFGGMGLMWENHVSRAFRDLRGISIGGGTDEIMTEVISKRLGFS